MKQSSPPNSLPLPTGSVSGKSQLRTWLGQVYRCRQLYWLILPGIIAVLIFHYIPIYGLQIAFKDYRTSLGIWGSEWVGLRHFIQFVQHPYFGRIMWNTLRISLYSLATFPIPVIFALMINELTNTTYKKVVQMVSYAPHFVSTVVVCSMTILFLNTDNGVVNHLIAMLGGQRQSYMENPSMFAPIFVITDLWQHLGWNTIIYLSALAGLSLENIEAAQIDGASRFQIVRHINIPHLLPTVITLFILRMGSLVNVGFEKVFLLQNQLNMEASSVVSTYVYTMGLVNQQFSLSSAIGLFNNLINIALIVSANFIAKRVSDVGLW